MTKITEDGGDGQADHESPTIRSVDSTIRSAGVQMQQLSDRTVMARRPGLTNQDVLESSPELPPSKSSSSLLPSPSP